MPRTRLVGRLALLTAAALCALSLSAAAAEVGPGRWFDGVLIVVLENQDYDEVVEHPFMKKLAESGTLLVDYQGLTHPSYGNYLGLVAGSDFAVGDNKQKDFDATSIADLLEQKGLSWKQYAEGFPGNCFKGNQAGTYFRKHAPFASFKAIQNDARRCANLLPATAFDPNGLPNYALYIPDANNSGHDTGLDFAADWLEKFLTR